MGAGLLAKAIDHSTVMSTDLTHSRASPLPQG
ncbi:metal ABC transporter ATP-binding protein, partial [Pseudomonas sp. F01002]